MLEYPLLNSVANTTVGEWRQMILAIEAEAAAVPEPALNVERLARALPYWRETNRETCLEDAAVILDRLGLPPGDPIERHRDEARQAALQEVLAKPPYTAARLSDPSNG